MLQWNDDVTVEEIEGGYGWMNVHVLAIGIDPRLYVQKLVEAVIDSGDFVTFAVDDAEVALVTSNSFTTLSSPIKTIDEDGYNSGNLLTGTNILSDVLRGDRLIIAPNSCHCSFGWHFASMEPVV
jgi:hypothetical protein